MTPDRRMLIGRTFPPVTYVISEENVRDYLPVAGEDYPAFRSDDGARAAGYARRVIPPSFAPFVALGLLRSFDWETDFFLDYRTGTAMFGEQELEYLRPLYVGETLTIQGTVFDVYEKQGGSGNMLFVVFEYDYVNQHGRTAVRVTGTRIRR